MNSLDCLILVLLVLTTVYAIVAFKRANSLFTRSIGLLVLLVVIQLFWKGFYWQYMPAYWQLGLLIIIAYLNSVSYRRLQHISLGVLLVVALMPWAMFLPVPSLTEPLGKYAVGTQVFRWVDSTRTEQITTDPFDKRNVIVQAWYPAKPNEKGIHSMYLDGLPNLPPRVSVLPSFLLDHYDQMDTYAVSKATPAKARQKWPVVLFLPGYGAARAFYTSLAVGLASHGYVVFCLDHPYESAITGLANGKLATTIENFQPGAPDRLGFMKNRLDIRVADVRFVLNQLESKQSSPTFFSSLDLNRIGIAGHSFGGATGGAAMAHDSRIKAAVNIDGTLYGGLPKSRGARPFLLIESHKDKIGRFARYEAGNQLLFKQFGGGHRYELTDADHYSFTDVPLLLAPPARLLAGYALSFGQVPTKTHRATVSLLAAFFDHTLNGSPSQLDAVASRYAGIVSKQVVY
ncbi:alpha/beta hydrolase family protein [Spirosoma gilvum]